MDIVFDRLRTKYPDFPETEILPVIERTLRLRSDIEILGAPLVELDAFEMDCLRIPEQKVHRALHRKPFYWPNQSCIEVNAESGFQAPI